MISIHTTRVGGDCVLFKHMCKFVWISIHTTRVGGDSMLHIPNVTLLISIHTTRVGGDYAWCVDNYTESNFNPHHPCGWWHSFISNHFQFFLYFNPHHPCGWWQFHHETYINSDYISIHTTRVGGDSVCFDKSRPLTYFNPHHPCGWWLYIAVINIQFWNFNPHHPCGWWHKISVTDAYHLNFNPHHPCGWWPEFVT